MSTKFYWLPKKVSNYNNLEKNDPKIYIGKRLSSGLFCWDCGVPAHDSINDTMLSCCPECNNKFIFKYDMNKTRNRSGVGMSARFVWSMLSHKMKMDHLFGLPDLVIEDEYGNAMATEDFMVDEMFLVVEEKVVYHRG
jgi:DNA-directed RNA polymerase subunit RPC12/RpoP